MCNAWKTCVRESLHAWYLKIVWFRRFIPLTWIIFRADNDEHGLNVLFQWEHCQIQDSGSLHKFTCKLLESQIWQFSHWNRELRLCSSFSARKIIQDRGMDLLNRTILRYQVCNDSLIHVFHALHTRYTRVTLFILWNTHYNRCWICLIQDFHALHTRYTRVTSIWMSKQAQILSFTTRYTRYTRYTFLYKDIGILFLI